MPSGSSVFVTLKLVGASKFAGDAKGVSVSLEGVGAASGEAAAGLGRVSERSTIAESRLGKLQLAARRGASGLSGVGTMAAGAVGALSRVASIAGVGAAFGLYEAAKGAISFDQAMRNVNSIAQLAPAQFNRIEKSVAGLAGKTAQTPVTLAEGLYDLVSSGFNARQAMVILRSSARAATAGLTDTATSTKAVAAVLNAYQLPASQANKVSNILFQTVNRGVISFSELASNIGTVLPFAASLHVGLGQVGAAISTMTKQGISGEMSITYLKNALVAFTKPSKDLAAAITQTGAASGEALIKSNGFEGALRKVIATTDGSKAAIAQLFPNIRASAAVLGLTGRNAKTAAGDLKGFSDVSGATGRVLAQQSQSVAYQWNKLKSTISGTVDTLALRFLPAASKAVGAASKFIGGVSGQAKPKTVRDVQTGTTGVAKPTGAAAVGANVRSTIGGVASQVIPVVQSIAAKAIPIVKNVISTVIPAAKTAITQLIGAIKPAVPFFQNVLLPLIIGIGKGVLGGIVMAFKVAIPIIKVVATVLGAVGKAAAPFRGVIEKIGEVIGVVFGPAILRAIGMLDRVGVVARALLIPFRIVEGAARTVGSVFGLAVKGISKFSNAIVFMNRWLAMGDTAFERLLGKVTNFVAGTIGKLEQLPGKARGVLQKMMTAITSKLGSVGSALLKGAESLGRAIVSGMVNAIKAAPAQIISAINSIIPKPLRSAVGGILGTAGTVGGAVAGFAGKIFHGLASGGTVRTPLQVVGERGPEIAALPIGSRVFTARETRSMLGRGGGHGPTAMAPGTLTIVNHNHVTLDGREVHHSVYKHERRLAEIS